MEFFTISAIWQRETRPSLRAQPFFASLCGRPAAGSTKSEARERRPGSLWTEPSSRRPGRSASAPTARLAASATPARRAPRFPPLAVHDAPSTRRDAPRPSPDCRFAAMPSLTSSHRRRYGYEASAESLPPAAIIIHATHPTRRRALPDDVT